jgi:hypothetical protein
MRGDLIFTLTSFLSRQRERMRITSLPVKFSGVFYPLIDSSRPHILQYQKNVGLRLILTPFVSPGLELEQNCQIDFDLAILNRISLVRPRLRVQSLACLKLIR